MTPSTFSRTAIGRILPLLLLMLLLSGCAGRTVPQGVSLGGLELGGMARREASAALAEAEETLLGRSLTVLLPQGSFTLAPEKISLRFQASRAVKDACKAAPGDVLSLGDYLSYDEELIRQGLLSYAENYDTVLTQPRAELSGPLPPLGEAEYDPSAPCPELQLTPGTPERHLDVDAAMEKIGDCLASSFSRREDALTIDVPAEEEPRPLDLNEIWAEFCREPVDASLDMEQYVPVPGVYGCGFDREAAEKQLAAALPGETVSLPMTAVRPEILSGDVYFRNELGSCDTPHSDNQNRNTNLTLICQILDGHILLPGEEFSFNGVVGERTAERGFLPAPAFSGNRLVQDYGGGACQCSTTLYNCALLADVEITHRVCHGAKVSYVPLGLDATVNWNTHTDLTFRNSFHFPMMIRAEVSDGHVKMKLLGTDEKDYYVKMETRSGDDEVAIYATSYKCKYDKATNEQLSREVEARSTYYKNIG